MIRQVEDGCTLQVTIQKSRLTERPLSWNEKQRCAERRWLFNVNELKNLAAAAVGRSQTDVVSLVKLAKGGSNRTFLLSMQDGFQMVARIPYPTTEPKNLLVAIEVATMNYLRSCVIPTPKVYDYSTTSHNPAGTEYIIMEFIRGTNLGDIWFALGEKARIKVVRKLVELESRLFSLKFPASGSLYYTVDLDNTSSRVQVEADSESTKDSFCIGPDLDLAMWYGNRLDLQTFQGPCK